MGSLFGSKEKTVKSSEPAQLTPEMEGILRTALQAYPGFMSTPQLPGYLTTQGPIGTELMGRLQSFGASGAAPFMSSLQNMAEGGGGSAWQDFYDTQVERRGQQLRHMSGMGGMEGGTSLTREANQSLNELAAMVGPQIMQQQLGAAQAGAQIAPQLMQASLDPWLQAAQIEAQRQQLMGQQWLGAQQLPIQALAAGSGFIRPLQGATYDTISQPGLGYQLAGLGMAAGGLGWTPFT